MAFNQPPIDHKSLNTKLCKVSAIVTHTNRLWQLRAQFKPQQNLLPNYLHPQRSATCRRIELSKNHMCVPFSRAYSLIYAKNPREVLVMPFSKLSKRSTGTCSSILVRRGTMSSAGRARIHARKLYVFQINAYITANTHIVYVAHVCDHSNMGEMVGRRAFRLV